MKITLLLMAKTDASYLVEGVAMYEKRLQKYGLFEILIIPDLKNAASLSVEEVKQREGKLLMKQFAPADWVILLDEFGKQLSSVEFAQHLQHLFNRALKSIKFVCGGAYGFSEEVYERANGKISLSRMTFSHQLVRLIFVEQLYRAFTILNNEPYHHE